MTKPPILAAGVAALGLAALLAGCGSDSSGPATPSATSSSSSQATKQTAVKTGAKKRSDSDGDGIPDTITVKGSLGDTLALQGSGLNQGSSSHEKTKIRVTLKGIRGPFHGFDLPPGRQLIGIDLRFVNVGRLDYSNPLPHGDLIVKGGESAKQTNLIAIGRKSPCDNQSVKIKAGQTKSTCIAFEVPKSDKPQSFQYVSDSGFGDTGLWSLR